MCEVVEGDVDVDVLLCGMQNAHGPVFAWRLFWRVPPTTKDWTTSSRVKALTRDQTDSNLSIVAAGVEENYSNANMCHVVS